MTNDPVITHLAVGYAGGFRNGTLIKFGKRWYDTNTGRFTQQDSLNFIGDPGAGNRYAYAGDNPLNHVDLTGKAFWAKIAGGITAGAIDTTCTGLVTGLTGSIGAGGSVGCWELALAAGAHVETEAEKDGL